MDQEANVLFPTMCDKLQKAMAIRPEYDITKEIITEQYQSDQQKRRYAPKLQQAAVMLFADFFYFHRFAAAFLYLRTISEYTLVYRFRSNGLWHQQCIILSVLRVACFLSVSDI